MVCALATPSITRRGGAARYRTRCEDVRTPSYGSWAERRRAVAVSFLKIVYGLPSRLRRGAKYTPEPQGKRKRRDTAMRQNPDSYRYLSDTEVWMQSKEQEKYKRRRS